MKVIKNQLIYTLIIFTASIMTHPAYTMLKRSGRTSAWAIEAIEKELFAAQMKPRNPAAARAGFDLFSRETPTVGKSAKRTISSKWASRSANQAAQTAAHEAPKAPS